MKKFKILLIIVVFSALQNCFAQSVQVKDGWFYVDGNKFFIKGIGYETHTRPGQVPWVYNFDADLIKFDLQRIKSAGFNTVRTWGAITEEELKLVEESGLKILFGIWIDPQGDFGNETFRTSVTDQVNSVLGYTNRYKSIIGYLIMNEPQVDHIHNAGSQNLLNLWQSVITSIHQKHPGIPVSFSNAIVGDYINMNIFDFAAYNAYIYNPVTFSNSHGYNGFLSYLKNNRANQKPFIVTEFGLSVSPGSSTSKYTYGGNTLEKQTSGNLLMYRELIDAGAQGGCVFQYHDGWWKSDNTYIHDPMPEEWFGLIEFTSQTDKYGNPRPVWSEFAKYNKAIITNPRNEVIYSGKIPVEIFTTDDVNSFSITANNSVLFQQTVSNNYYNGSFEISINDDIKDFKLTFNFYKANGDTLKSETISILRTKNQISLPGIKMVIAPFTLNPGSKNYLLFEVTNNSLFSIEENKVDYVVHPHIGFSEGSAKSKTILLVDDKYSFQDYFDIPNGTKVATFGAGFTIRRGDFTKRIFTQSILTSGTWTNPIKASDVDITTKIDENTNDENEIKLPVTIGQNYPNPFNPSTRIEYSLAKAGNVKIEIYNSICQLVNVLENSYHNAGNYSLVWNGNNSLGNPVNSGIYFYRINSAGFTVVKKMILVR